VIEARPIPHFVGLSALIVLPVAILSGVALHFLREDRITVQQEARDLAMSIAPEAARQFGEAAGKLLSEDLKIGHLQQGEIVDGLGLAVPDYPRLPSPADWSIKLPSRLANLWRTAQEAADRSNAEAASDALAVLAATGASPAARANAQLGLLAAAERGSHYAGLVHQAVVLAQQYPTEVTESGVPVGSGGCPPVPDDRVASWHSVETLRSPSGRCESSFLRSCGVRVPLASAG